MATPVDYAASRRALVRLEAETPHGEEHLIPARFVGRGPFSTLRAKQDEEEIRQLYEAVLNLGAKSICEIGTYRGGTLYLWCRAAAADATIVSIDYPPAAGGWYSFSRRCFYRAFRRPGQRLILIPGSSRDIRILQRTRAALREHALDFLFIDGDHSYEGVASDFALFSPLVRSGGLVALHDIVPRRDAPQIEVFRLWEKLRRQYKCREFIAEAGPFANLAGIGLVTMP